MILWTHVVLGVLYERVLYFCICTCSAQLSMLFMERRSRNTIIIIIIIIYLTQEGDRSTVKVQSLQSHAVLADKTTTSSQTFLADTDTGC